MKQVLKKYLLKCYATSVLMLLLLGNTSVVATEVNLAACEWRDRNDMPVKAECGEYQTDDGFGLPIVRLPATRENNNPPLFLLSGGPGASNLWERPFPWLYQDNDFVMVGYRGADGESRLECDISKAQLGVGNDLLSKASLTQFSNGVARCVDQLQIGGFDLTRFTIMQVIEDMEAVRKTLSYQTINLLSESYGTRVAQIYSAEHPSAIKRSVQIGINPAGHMVWEPEIIDEQLNQLSALCAVEDYCKAQTQDLVQTLARTLKAGPRSWFGFDVNPGIVRFLGFNMLFNRDSAAMFLDSVFAADKGDDAGFALLTLLYKLQISFGDTQPLGDLFAKGMVDFDPNRDYEKELNSPESIMGSPMSELLMSAGPVWPAVEFPDQYKQAFSFST